MDIDTGISVIMNSWMQLKRDEVLHFITDETHLREAEAVKRWASQYNVVLKLTLLPSDSVQSGDVIEQIAYQLSYVDAIIGATDFSFITTSAVKNATRKGARFLSLPLSCTDGRSLFEQDFIAMDTRWAEKAAHFLTGVLNKNDTVHITTRRGTDLFFSKKGRRASYFNGVTAKRGALGSSSFETYIPICEYETEGTLFLDASLGYLGKISEPFFAHFHQGRLSTNSTSSDAKRLTAYIKHFHDEEMWINGELGIGLNTLSHCRGVSYIEDESTYGTFHIGMGRNIALGGNHQAAGHFDIVTYKPTIYVGSTLVMKDGKLNM